MDWSGPIAMMIGAFFGFGIGWSLCEVVKLRARRTYLQELLGIVNRLKVIHDKMQRNDPTLTPVEIAEYMSAPWEELRNAVYKNEAEKLTKEIKDA